MRTFTTNFNLEKNLRTGGAPMWILECAFPVTGTVYISDVALTITGWQAAPITTLALVNGWGGIDEDLSGGDLAAPRISDFSLGLINDPDAAVNIAQMLWTQANNLEQVDINLYLWYRGLDASTDPPVKVWTGNIQDFNRDSEILYQVKLVDLTMKYLDKYLGTKIDLATYPNADPDEVGKVGNIIYGTVTKAPCQLMESGAITTLKADITAAATDFYLTSGDGLANGDTIKVDDEEITITTISGAHITACTRGAGGTTATAHNKGASVVEQISTDFVYRVADHPVKSISKVYVRVGDEDVDITADCTLYTGQTGSNYTGYSNRYSGKAVVIPTDIPSIKKKVNLTAPDDIDVSSSGTNKTSYPVSPTDADIMDGSDATYQETAGSLTVSFYNEDLGAISGVYVYVTASSADASATTFRVTFGGISEDYTISGTTPSTFRLYVSGSRAWNAQITLEQISGSNTRFCEVWRVNEYVPTMTKSGGVTVAGNSTANNEIGEMVLIDGEGYQDDGSGTFTGTPAALIERPDHVFKHLLYTYAGLPVANFQTSSGIGTNFGTTYKFAGIMGGTDYKKIKEWCAILAWQCRCWFRFYKAEAWLIWRPDSLTSAKTITQVVTRMEEETARSTLKVSRSGLDQIINKISALYDRDWTQSGDGAYKKLAAVSDAPSIAAFGTKERPELFQFDFVIGQTMAEALRDFYLKRYKRRPKLVAFESFLNNAELEFADALGMNLHNGLVPDTEHESGADIADWTDGDAGGGASTQVTFDGKSCFKFDSGAVAAGGNYARRYKTGKAIPDHFFVEVNLYHEALGTTSADNYFLMTIHRSNVRLRVLFATNGIFIMPAATGGIEIGTDLVQTGAWQKWRFEVDAVDPNNAVCSVYLNDVPKASGIDCSETGSYTAGQIQFYQYGSGLANRITYLDYLKIGRAGHHTNNEFAVDFFREEGADIAPWTDADAGTGASTQVTFDGKSCFKFDSGGTLGAGHYAQRDRTILGMPIRFSVTMNLHHAALGTSGGDYFQVGICRGDIMLWIIFATNGLFIFDGAAWNEVGADLVQTGAWQKWRFEVDCVSPGDARCVVYLNDVLQDGVYDCSYTGSFSEGFITMHQLGTLTANRITYLDYLYIGDLGYFLGEIGKVNFQPGSGIEERPDLIGLEIREY